MIVTSLLTASLTDITTHLQDRRLISAEFMYKPRPMGERECRVFDFTLHSRLRILNDQVAAAVLFICNDAATADSLSEFRTRYPKLPMIFTLANPQPIAPNKPNSYADTPLRCGWAAPERWRRYELTDRWARIRLALDTTRQLAQSGYLIMPAHDAVWGCGLLERLIHLSERHAKNGLPAAVSPYTYYQHSAVPGVEMNSAIIDGLNAAFARDSWRWWRLRSGSYQAFWGKMGLIPFGLCGAVLRNVEMMVWEDDLEIDRAIRAAGCAVRGQWISDPDLYRQALPVFDRTGLRAVIERTLHYSLNLPGKFYGEKSLLNQPLDRLARLRRKLDRRWDRAVALSETVIAECNAEIAARIQRCGLSWVDWGAYRYVVRVGDPFVQVWKYDGNLVS